MKFRETGQGKDIGKIQEMQGIRKDGREFPCEASMSAVQHQGEWHIIMIVRDITERKRMEAELKHLSYHDWLTGLAKRNRVCSE
jgi:PAS domain S-box-containing protein